MSAMSSALGRGDLNSWLLHTSCWPCAEHPWFWLDWKRGWTFSQLNTRIPINIMMCSVVIRSRERHWGTPLDWRVPFKMYQYIGYSSTNLSLGALPWEKSCIRPCSYWLYTLHMRWYVSCNGLWCTIWTVSLPIMPDIPAQQRRL